MNFKYIRDKLGFLIHNPNLDLHLPINYEIPPMVKKFNDADIVVPKSQALIKKDIVEKLKSLRARYGDEGYEAERDTTLFALRPVNKPKINNVSSSGKGYVFFGRPDLNMFNKRGGISEGVTDRSISNRDPLVHDSDLRDKVSRNKLVARLLDRSNGDKTSYRVKSPNNVISNNKEYYEEHVAVNTLVTPHFIPLLSNNIDAFNTPDKSLGVTESNKTIFGAHIKYPLHNEGDVSNASISITFNETKDNDVYHLFDMWTHYMASIRRGISSPRIDYIHNGETDYDVPIYVFLTDEDGMTVTWWCKYISCYPISTPSGSFDVTKGQMVTGHKQHSITFNTARFEPTSYGALDKDLITMWYKSGKMDSTNNKSFIKFLTKEHKSLVDFQREVTAYNYTVDYTPEMNVEFTLPNVISKTPEDGYRIPVIIKVLTDIAHTSHKLLWLIKS